MSQKSKRLTRRDFLKVAGTAAGMATLVACQPAPTAAPTAAPTQAAAPTVAPTTAPAATTGAGCYSRARRGTAREGWQAHLRSGR